MPNPITETELVEDMRRVNEEIDEPLTQTRYNNLGKYSIKPAKRIFGTWRKACKSAGIETSKKGPNQLSDEDILNDLKRVAEKIGEPPSLSQYAEHGNHGTGTLQRRFGGIKNARVKAGLGIGPTRYRKPSEKELLNDLKRLAEEYGEPVTCGIVNKHGRWTDVTYYKRFGTLSEALNTIGLDPLPPGGQVGELNSHWKGGYDPYYGENWYEQREKARKRDGYECKICGIGDKDHINKYGRELEVHHIIRKDDFDSKKKANELSNLITLCRKHHKKYEHLGEKGRKGLRGLIGSD